MSSSLRYRIGLAICASIFFISGSLHWIAPAPLLKIMPPFLPCPLRLVQISGAAEILGAIGLLLPRFRRAAGFGLAALLVAVFPANIYMAVGHVSFNGFAGRNGFAGCVCRCNCR